MHMFLGAHGAHMGEIYKTGQLISDLYCTGMSPGTRRRGHWQGRVTYPCPGLYGDVTDGGILPGLPR